MDMVFSIAKDSEDNLSCIYVGYDYQGAKDAVTAANPPIGYTFRLSPAAAVMVMRAPGSEDAGSLGD
jgi:hypothetical protein